MNGNPIIRYAVLATSLLMSAAVQAQSADDPWYVVEAQWDAEQQGDDSWIDEMLADNFVGWGYNSPAPRSKRSTAMWDRFNDEHERMVAHELYLMSITIHGDVAIAHYLYSSANEDADGKVETTNGR